jgi:hypothetical protein
MKYHLLQDAPPSMEVLDQIHAKIVDRMSRTAVSERDSCVFRQSLRSLTMTLGESLQKQIIGG